MLGRLTVKSLPTDATFGVRGEVYQVPTLHWGSVDVRGDQCEAGPLLILRALFARVNAKKLQATTEPI